MESFANPCLVSLPSPAAYSRASTGEDMIDSELPLITRLRCLN